MSAEELKAEYFKARNALSSHNVRGQEEAFFKAIDETFPRNEMPVGTVEMNYRIEFSHNYTLGGISMEMISTKGRNKGKLIDSVVIPNTDFEVVSGAAKYLERLNGFR